MGPLAAAFIVVPFGQTSISWFAIGSLIGIVVLWQVGNWYIRYRKAVGNRPAAVHVSPFSRSRVAWSLVILTMLVLSKNAYIASLSSYYTFYTIERFGVSVQMSQVLLFAFLGASALGILLGGPF